MIINQTSLSYEVRVFNAIMEGFNSLELEGTGVILAVNLLYQVDVGTLGHFEPY
jgi:hypothetical protein